MKTTDRRKDAENGLMHGCNKCQGSICWDKAAAAVQLQVERPAEVRKVFSDMHSMVLVAHLLLATRSSSVLMI